MKQEESRKKRELSLQADREHQANLRYKLKDNLNSSAVVDPKKQEEE